jgi:hypothetical protein
MKTHADFIMEATGCKREEVSKIDDMMRENIFHSTLDWQTREQIDEAAVLAYDAIKEIENLGGMNRIIEERYGIKIDE